tara:strand:+ start:233 stop:460 length:228 start_codon:yes stop_codon:yes gene_type:complete
MEIKSKVEKIIRNKFKITDFNLELSSDYIEKWDSLSHLSLMLKIEENFSVKFTQKEITIMTNISEIIKVLKSKTK